MTIVRVGTTKKYSENFEAAFGKKKTAKPAAGEAPKAAAPKASAKKSSTDKPAPKKAAKKAKK